MNREIKVELTSVPDRDDLVAELWFDQSMLGELRKQSGRIQLELYSRKDGQPWDLDALILVDAINKARARLYNPDSNEK